MRDVPISELPEVAIEQRLRDLEQRLKTEIGRYIAEAKKGPYLGYLNEAQTKAAEERAFALAMPKLHQELVNNPNAEIDLQPIILATAHRALKEQNSWAYYDNLPDIDVEGIYPNMEGDYEDYVPDEQTAKEMEAIMLENYKDKPQEFREAVLASFRGALTNRNSSFKVMRSSSDVLAFCRLDYHFKEKSKQQYPGDTLDYIYLGSVNLNPKFISSRIGETIIQKVLEKELDDNPVPLKADCEAYSPTGRNYIEKYGFMATKFYDFHGVPSLEIVNQAEEYRFISRRMTNAELVVLVDQPNELIRVQSNRLDQKPNMSLLNQGYYLTRYFTQGDKIYTVFELNDGKYHRAEEPKPN